jgi:hypothetical protein
MMIYLFNHKGERKMKKALLVLPLLLGLSTQVNATEIVHAGGWAHVAPATKLAAISGFGLMAYYAYQSNDYTCKIVKTPPKPGTNYTNEKSVCTKR